MPTWKDICDVVQPAMTGLYDNYGDKMRDTNHTVRNLDVRLGDEIEPHLRRAMNANRSDWPPDITVDTQYYSNCDKKQKEVEFGDHGGKRQLSVILHTPNYNPLNVLALLVKQIWTTDEDALYWNYWTAVGLIGSKMYPFAVCIELSKLKSQSKAYLTTLERLNDIGYRQYQSLANDIYDARELTVIRQRRDEVARLRDKLFTDVSSDLFAEACVANNSTPWLAGQRHFDW